MFQLRFPGELELFKGRWNCSKANETKLVLKLLYERLPSVFDAQHPHYRHITTTNHPEDDRL